MTFKDLAVGDKFTPANDPRDKHPCVKTAPRETPEVVKKNAQGFVLDTIAARRVNTVIPSLNVSLWTDPDRKVVPHG